MTNEQIKASMVKIENGLAKQLSDIQVLEARLIRLKTSYSKSLNEYTDVKYTLIGGGYVSWES